MGQPFSDDTSQEAHDVQVALLRAMTPAQRIERMRALTRGARRMAEARLRRDYPDDTPRQRQLRLAALRIPRELMIAAFGWDPDIEGR